MVRMNLRFTIAILAAFGASTSARGVDEVNQQTGLRLQNLYMEMVRLNRFNPSFIGAVIDDLTGQSAESEFRHDSALHFLDRAVISWPKDPGVGEFFLQLVPHIPKSALAAHLTGWSGAMHLVHPKAAAEAAKIMLISQWKPMFEGDQQRTMGALTEQIGMMIYTDNLLALNEIGAAFRNDQLASQRLGALLRGDDGAKDQALALGIVGVLQLQNAEAQSLAEKFFRDENSEFRLAAAGVLVLSGRAPHADTAFQVLLDAANRGSVGGEGEEAYLFLYRAQQLKLRTIPIGLRLKSWIADVRFLCSHLLSD